MTPSPMLSVIVPTTPARREKLAALLRSLGGEVDAGGPVELVLVVDAESDEPIRLARELAPRGLPVRGLTQPPAGPAAARNAGLRAAHGAWALFLDDDMLLTPGTLGEHVQRIRRAPDACAAYLGPVDLPPRHLDSRWTRLLCSSAMLFFPDAASRERCGFRYFWSGHISVRRDLVLEVGGFDGRFPSAMHEDIELGWRLERRFGLHVEPLPQARAWHDHPLTPRQYLEREHRSGGSAAAAREINRAFHDELWARFGSPAATLDVLWNVFELSARQTYDVLQRWAEPSGEPASAEELHTAYLAHLPLKRIAFLEGYAGRQFEDLHARLCGCAAAASRPGDRPAPTSAAGAPARPAGSAAAW